MTGSAHCARRDDYVISTDPSLLDARAAHAFVSRSYWANGIPLETVRRSLENSLAFGVYILPSGASDFADRAQIGLARVITDKATYAYLCDVYILEAHRGQGLSKWLMEVILAHPDLQGLRRFCLFTRDAHGLYEKFGFGAMPEPARYMERVKKNAYSSPPTSPTSPTS